MAGVSRICAEPVVVLRPTADPLVLPLASGYGQHRTFRFIDGRVWLPRPIVELNEDAERHPGSTLIAVGEWMVACESLEQNGGFSTNPG